MHLNAGFKRVIHCLMAAAICLESYAFTSALAKGRADSPSIFSSPDAESDVVPTFIGKDGKPFNASRELRGPVLGEVMRLPSITKEQRIALERIRRELALRLSSLREHIVSLEQKLDVAKGHPGERIEIAGSNRQYERLPSAAEIKLQIASLRKDIQAQQRQAGQQATALLSEQQLKEYELMRAGELTISGEPTDGCSAKTNSRKNSSNGNHGRLGALVRKLVRKD